MRDTLDVNAGKNRIAGIAATVISVLLFAAFLAFLIVRKNNIREAELATNQNAQPIPQISGEELFPELYEDGAILGESDVSVSGNGEQLQENEESVQNLPENTYALPDKDTVTFTFAGDVLLDEEYAVMSTYRANGSVLEECIDPELLDIMRGSDIFMINNEFPYTNRGTPLANKAFTFCADPANVQVLKDMGVDIVSLANNHASDYGEISLLDTLDTLEGAGIPYVGAGRDLDEASKVVFYQNGDVKIGIVSATEVERLATPDTKGATADSPGTFRCFQNDALEEVIREAKKECDFLIVYVHWGTESTDEPDWSQPGQAADFTAAGADVVIGAHPHVLQEIAYVNDVPVFYSLGNYWFNSKSQDSCLVTLEIGEEGLVSAKFIPCRTESSRTYLATGEEATRILDYMRGLSEGVSIDADGYVTPQ
ncbi:MAG: CapA family protein [Lachnospiraceae bacterium]|nr:CapA family protein [Lachnospiraceae bacterium]